ncbi:uncharacterized protein [Anabrus simplex]|uniref:uncharacterized protein n=1 Tax=Anabrus simplex TaxID=316456 RepID=UPI0035A3942C
MAPPGAAQFSLILLTTCIIWSARGNVIIPPEWIDDERGSVSGAEESLDEALNEVLQPLPTGRSMAMIRPFPLEEMYFHDDRQQVTVTLKEMKGSSDLQFESRHIDTILAEQRAELELELALLVIQGRYEVDRQAYGDYDSREEGDFMLTLSNITASGIAMLNVDGSTISVSKTLLDYEPEEVKFKVNRNLEDEHLWRYTSSDTFGESIKHKVWRGLTHRLNKAVKEKLKSVLSKTSLGNLIGDEETQERLQKYIITNTENANEFVDNIIKAVRKMVVDKYEDQIKIPDIREGFERTLVITIHGSFVADQGVAKGISTVYRTGETRFGRDNDSNVHFFGNIGFEDINLYYKRYRADFMGLGPTGTINTELYPLELHVHFHVDFGQKKVYLDEFKVENVGDLKVEVSGLGFLFNWLASLISTWVVGMYRDEFLDEMEKMYDNYISSTLNEYSLDDILSGKAF